MATMPEAAIPLPVLRARRVDAHKASVGRVLVVGGSTGMAGAPALAARGALRAGAGLVTLAVPSAIYEVVASFLPETMTVPLPCDGEGALGVAALPALLPLMARADVLVVGPGLGRSAPTEAFVHALLARASGPLVLDADALHALRGRAETLTARQGTTVLTPHEGEAAVLLGVDTLDLRAARAEHAQRLARLAHAICVLKGPGTLVTDGTRLRRNETGGPVLAAGGSGDVLAGVLAAFLAGLPDTGDDAFGAAVLAVHVHGLAGDALAARRGDRGVLASEIADAIPEAIRALRAAGGGR